MRMYHGFISCILNSCCRLSPIYQHVSYFSGARFKEGCNINRSLFTLGQVIKKLTDEGQK